MKRPDRLLDCWQPLGWRSVGGLRQVGFAENSDLLFVISSAGAGIFDCQTGELVYRDREYALTFVEEVWLVAIGVGPLADQLIRVAGLHGGGLRRMTEDRWALDIEAHRWPHHDIYLREPGFPGHLGRRVLACDDEPCELRAVGFSETGNSFVVATSCDIRLFARQGKLG
jgi:hypothetical protein